MTVSTTKYLATALLLAAGTTHADISAGPDPYASGFGFDKPQEAQWGGWIRGSTGSAWAEWDAFNDASHGSAKDRTAAADVGQSGLSSAYAGWSAGTFATGAGNLYSFSLPETFAVQLSPAPTLTSSGKTVIALQLEVSGGGLASNSVKLNGLAPGSLTQTYVNHAFPSPVGDTSLVHWLALWELDAPVSSFAFGFSAAMHTSLQQLAIDIGKRPLVTPPSEVPVPAAAWLFGSALLATASLRRRQA